MRGRNHVELMAGGELGGAIELRMPRFHEEGVVVAEQKGAVAAEIVDVAVAVDVPLRRAEGAGDVERIGIEMPAVMRVAARQLRARLARQRGGSRRGRLVGRGKRGIRRSDVGYGMQYIICG